MKKLDRIGILCDSTQKKGLFIGSSKIQSIDGWILNVLLWGKIMKKISLSKEKQELIIRRNNFFSGNYFHLATPRTEREARFFKLVKSWNANSILRERS